VALLSIVDHRGLLILIIARLPVKAQHSAAGRKLARVASKLIARRYRRAG
jgi:CRISPR/Cas system Type II protein with McrA/HNH and RuvC-like nuclease domain